MKKWITVISLDEYVRLYDLGKTLICIEPEVIDIKNKNEQIKKILKKSDYTYENEHDIIILTLIKNNKELENEINNKELENEINKKESENEINIKNKKESENEINIKNKKESRNEINIKNITKLELLDKKTKDYYEHQVVGDGLKLNWKILNKKLSKEIKKNAKSKIKKINRINCFLKKEEINELDEKSKILKKIFYKEEIKSKIIKEKIELLQVRKIIKEKTNLSKYNKSINKKINKKIDILNKKIKKIKDQTFENEFENKREKEKIKFFLKLIEETDKKETSFTDKLEYIKEESDKENYEIDKIIITLISLKLN